MSTADNPLVNLREEYEKRQIQELLDELEHDLIGLVGPSFKKSFRVNLN
jgi:hypothetical protein